MGIVKISRANETSSEFVNGLSKQPILVDEYSDCAFARCVLQAGSRWEPELYKFEEKCQIFLFIGGTGYIATPTKAYNITETAVFVPLFDQEPFTIQAATDLQFFHILPVMSDYDIQAMTASRISLPRFRLLSQGWTYEEPFKSDNITSVMMLEHRELGRLSMGATLGVGPAENGDHIHNELEQWHIALPGSSFTYTASGESVKVEGGDITYTPHGHVHGSRSVEGEILDYIWFELCGDGYPGSIS